MTRVFSFKFSLSYTERVGVPEGLLHSTLSIYSSNFSFAPKIEAFISSNTSKDPSDDSADGGGVLKGIVENTVRIARLKLLFIAAKVVKNENVDKVKFSIHDVRTPGMLDFLKFLDKARSKPRPWHQGGIWPQRFAIAT